MAFGPALIITSQNTLYHALTALICSSLLIFPPIQKAISWIYSAVTPFNYSASDLPISDHMLITFNVKVTLSKTKQPRTIYFCNIKDIDSTELDTGISNLPSIHFTSTPGELLSHYNRGLQNLLDTLAPLKSQTVSFTQSAPWFTVELRQLERLYRKTGFTIHKEMLTTKDSLTNTKFNYYAERIRLGTGNS